MRRGERGTGWGEVDCVDDPCRRFSVTRGYMYWWLYWWLIIAKSF
jgi:hypothetical protein